MRTAKSIALSKVPFLADRLPGAAKQLFEMPIEFRTCALFCTEFLTKLLKTRGEKCLLFLLFAKVDSLTYTSARRENKAIKIFFSQRRIHCGIWYHFSKIFLMNFFHDPF